MTRKVIISYNHDTPLRDIKASLRRKSADCQYMVEADLSAQRRKLSADELWLVPQYRKDGSYLKCYLSRTSASVHAVPVSLPNWIDPDTLGFAAFVRFLHGGQLLHTNNTPVHSIGVLSERLPYVQKRHVFYPDAHAQCWAAVGVRTSDFDGDTKVPSTGSGKFVYIVRYTTWDGVHYKVHCRHSRRIGLEGYPRRVSADGRFVLQGRSGTAVILSVEVPVALPRD